MVANSSAPIQSRQFIFSEPFAQSLPFYSTEKNKNKNKNKKGKTKKKKELIFETWEKILCLEPSFVHLSVEILHG